MMYCPSTIQNSKIIWATCKLLIKDTTESITSASSLDLLLSISSSNKFTLPFTNSEMFSISTTPTFRSLVIIFHLRRHMAFLSLSLYDTPGFTSHMNVLFWGPDDFPVSYLKRDNSWNAWMFYVNCHFDPRPFTVPS